MENKMVAFSITDKEGNEIKAGDYVETKFNQNSLARRGIRNNYHFKRIEKYGIVEKVCPKTVKVKHDHTIKATYLYSSEIRKISREEATFHKLRVAEKM